MAADDRMTRLETWMAHQDRLMDQLNDELCRQGQELDALRRRVEHVVEQLRSGRRARREGEEPLWAADDDEAEDRRLHGLDS